MQAQNKELPNFYQLNPRLFVGGQPTESGIRQLAAQGIKAVVSLRAEGRNALEDERMLVESLGMQWKHIPMRAYSKPSHKQVDDFLAIATAADIQPVFLHCRRGKDRSGVLVAVYHVVIEGWDPQAAYKDALARGMIPWNLWFRHVIFSAKKEYAGKFTQQPLQQNASISSGGG